MVNTTQHDAMIQRTPLHIKKSANCRLFSFGQELCLSSNGYLKILDETPRALLRWKSKFIDVCGYHRKATSARPPRFDQKNRRRKSRRFESPIDQDFTHTVSAWILKRVSSIFSSWTLVRGASKFLALKTYWAPKANRGTCAKLNHERSIGCRIW